MVARQCDGVLLPDLVLPFDDDELAGCTVADVLADPARFEGATLADPLEGIDYGVCKAKVMRRADGSLWIHSFAHGRTIYELKLDAAAVRAAMEHADKDAVVKLFIDLALAADLDDDELERSAQLRGREIRLSRRTHHRHAQGGLARERPRSAPRRCATAGWPSGKTRGR